MYVKQMIQSEKVRGFLLIELDDYPRPDAFSPDKACPNEGYGKFLGSPYCLW